MDDYFLLLMGGADILINHAYGKDEAKKIL